MCVGQMEVDEVSTVRLWACGGVGGQTVKIWLGTKSGRREVWLAG